jgi:hypothetical protein
VDEQLLLILGSIHNLSAIYYVITLTSVSIGPPLPITAQIPVSVSLVVRRKVNSNPVLFRKTWSPEVGTLVYVQLHKVYQVAAM